MTKSELLRRLVNEKARLDGVLAKLTFEQCMQANKIGVWSVKDRLAHFVAHEMRALEEWRYATRVEYPNIPIGNKDVFNLGAVLSTHSQSFMALKAAWNNLFGEIMLTIQNCN